MATRTTPRRLGRYQLLERLGQGSTAEVWKIAARGPSGFRSTRVAKRLLPRLAADAGFVSLLVEEAKLSARLDHPNVVRVFDLERIDGEYLLIMEFVDGCELRALLAALARRGAPPLGLGLYVAREVCRALEHAHGLVDEEGRALRVVHRDVSPTNVLLSRAGAVKLTDFGVANARTAAQIDRAAVQGNLAYMAPEQLAAQPVDARADVYALGVVLHECLTAQRLWKGAYDVEGMRLLRLRPIDPPSTINPAVTPAIDAICRRATATDPADRFASALEMERALAALPEAHGFGARELAALLAELAPAVGATPPAEPQRRTVTNLASSRRSRWPLFAASALVLVAAGGAWRLVHVARRAPGLDRPEPMPVAAATSPVPVPVPIAVPAGPAVPEPAVAERAPARRPARTRHTPDLIRGTLVDPFSR